MRLDVGIAGMGIGGLASAILLARSGHRVVMHDAMDKPAPVGSGFVLQPTGLAVLEVLGLREKAEARGSRIDRMLGLVRPSGRTVLDVSYPQGTYGIGIQRRTLFDLLFDAALDEGVSVETGCRVVEIGAGPRRRLFDAAGRHSHPFDLVVDAMGANSPCRPEGSLQLPYGALWATVPWRPEATFDPNMLEQRYLRASRMAGVLPVGTAEEGAQPMATLFWSVRGGQACDSWVEDMHALWPEAAALADGCEPTMARYRHHTHRRICEPGLVRIGDSAHATSPQLGQGANMALLDAVSLGTSLHADADVADAIAEHARRRRTHILFFQALSRVLTPFYQSDGVMLPAMRDHLIAPMLRRKGIIHAMVAAMVTGDVLKPFVKATAERSGTGLLSDGADRWTGPLHG
jgi:2-polyprenyl-6-methoxyphenol hydroxylase-like FAD-dependent oxidoreductase